MFAREVDGTKVILPVWHNITSEEVRAYSPMLADRLAATSSKGLGQVIEELTRAISAGSATANPNANRGPATIAGPRADVQITLRDIGRSERFLIENCGARVAYDVNLLIETKVGQGNPLVRGDFDEKLPVQVLRPGARVELIAALSDDTGTTFTTLLTWRDENGETQERREKVSLQSC